jgi:hypothetical protein
VKLGGLGYCGLVNLVVNDVLWRVAGHPSFGLTGISVLSYECWVKGVWLTPNLDLHPSQVMLLLSCRSM